MAGRYKPYPEYKDSEVEWLGKLPLAWSLSRHKHVAIFQKGKNPSELHDANFDGAAVYLSMDFLRGNSEPSFAKTEKNSCVAKNGQILVIWDGSNAGEFVKAKHGIVSSTMAVAELISDTDFGFYWYACNCLEPEMRRHAIGMGIPHVNGDELKSSIIPMPAMAEQIKIASFLDYETAKIDTLIEKQQQLIQLLKEKRQALISHAVTKGLSSLNGGPNAKLRDSGVEWLGEVPEGWKLPKLLHRTSKIGDGLHSTPNYQDGTGFYFVNGNNLVDGRILIGATAKEVPDDEYKKHYIHLDKFSVLLSINGTVGNVARYDNESVILGKSAAYINCNNGLSPEYLMLYLQTCEVKHYYDLEVTGTTIFNLSLNSIRKLKICMPSQSEQSEIVQYCSAQKEKYRELINKATSTIELMQERRSALISAAVTGKIDVRDWVAPPANKTNKEVAA